MKRIIPKEFRHCNCHIHNVRLECNMNKVKNKKVKCMNKEEVAVKMTEQLMPPIRANI